MKPKYPDCCCHGADCYVGSTMYTEQDQPVWIDVYIHNSTREKQEVCIRFGDNPEQYASAGPITEFMIFTVGSTTMPMYVAAFQLMITRGSLTFKMK